jgi:hypothetical protein
VLNNFRRLILGFDTNGGGSGYLRGFPTWNVDMQITKEISVKEKIAAQFSVQISNVLNHFQPSTPSLNIDSAANFGVVTGQANNPRQMEFGLRLKF